MRIRSLALSYMTGVGVLVAAASGTLAYHEWGRLAAVENADTLVRVIGAANRFVEAMALERGVYNQVIVSADADADNKRRLVGERVAATDAVFRDTLSELSRLPPSAARRFQEPVAEARDLVVATRGRGDQAWTTRQTDRNTAARALLSDFVKAGTVLDTAMVRLERALADENPRLGLMISASRLANEMREAAGQRSTILSRYAGTGEKLDGATATKVAELTGSIRGSWERLKRIVRQVENSPQLAAGVETTQATFMTEGERVYEQMASAARDGAPPPMPFLQWRAWTVAMLTNILASRDAPVAQALEDVQGLRWSAWTSLGLTVAGGAAAILLFFGAALFIERRVVRPVSRLTEALDRAADLGAESVERADLVQYGQREDEVGALSRALTRSQERSRELRKLHQRFDAALANLPQGLCVFDADQRLIVANSRYAEMYGLAADQVAPGTTLELLLQHRTTSGAMPHDAAAYIAKAIEDARRPAPAEGIVELQSGRAIAVSMQPLPDGGWVSTHEDITARREAEAQIAYMANHDALTDLPNRVLLHERMQQALARVERGEHAAVLCLDLDHFKTVNDTLGHPVGDKLLRAVAERLRGCVRATDTVARLGGDEFAILQVAAEQPNGASGLARRVIEAVGAPYDLDGHQVVVGTSVGVALAPGDASDANELLKSADLALYRSKAEGRGRYRFFEREMDARMQVRRTLEVDLRKALAAGEFELYFQPLMNLERNEVSGFEALLRWNHPERGLVFPGEFIPLAEEIGLIVPIGEWVLREACAAAARWPGEIRLAVNLSPAQFRTRTLVSTVLGALAASGLEPSRLELEITESVLLHEDVTNLSTLHSLRELGVRISLDDFGTGYSSLSYLRSFPFDKIKIDQSFVRELSGRSDCAAIVRAIASLGSTLGMTTTAEGVETMEQLEQLRLEGCTEVQGYLFSPPKPVGEIMRMLAPAGLGRSSDRADRPRAVPSRGFAA